MKTIISILAMILLVINMSSCTPENLSSNDTTATTGDIEQVIPPRDNDD